MRGAQTAGMRVLSALLACACAAARPSPAAPEALPCVALPLVGAADPLAIASDAEGGLAVAGKFEGALRVGSDTVASAGGSDVFVLRTAPDGSVLWLHRLGGAGQESASAVALAADGDAVVVGAASDHCFAARLAAADGRELWKTRLDGEGESNCRALAFDAAGDIWATGYFSGSLRGFTSNGMYDFFVLKLSGATGEAGLVRTIGGKGKELPRAVAALPSGGVLVAGQFGGEVDVSEAGVDFGKGRVQSAGDYDGFLLALGPDARTLWVATFGDSGDDEINALALGADGAIFASGHHQPAGNYQGLNPHGVGNFTGIVLRYSAQGRGEWVRVFEGPSSTANVLAFDEKGRLWTGGSSHGIRIGELSIDPAGKSDAYALALDPRTGDPLGARSWGSPEFDITRGLARIPGGLAVTGFTQGEVQICGKPVGSPGEQTGFVIWLRDL